MTMNVGKEVAAMSRMTVKQLRVKYAEVFGDETRTGNKPWLIKRITWRMQANAEGGLSERARLKAEEIANDADLRLSPPKAKPVSKEGRTATTRIAFSQDDRLPLPGAILTREYKGQSQQVRVLEKGFEFEGEVYKSLSAVAKKITGTHTNGYLFFKLKNGGDK